MGYLDRVVAVVVGVTLTVVMVGGSSGNLPPTGASTRGNHHDEADRPVVRRVGRSTPGDPPP